MKSHQIPKQSGVSLIEVLVALLVIAIGVLGLAKMQALTIANSQVSGLRGLIALQGASLAATMHSDKSYWQVTTGTAVPCAGASCTLTGSGTSTFGAVPSSCLNTNLCAVKPMVAWDVNNWMTQMNASVPGYSATINCANSTTLPVTCTIEITWPERQIGAGTATASIAAATPSVTQAYYLYVQP